MDKKKLFREVEGRLHNYKYLEMQINNLELDIEQEKNEYRGCGAISYDERTGVTYNISRSVENEVIAKEKRLEKLMQAKLEKKIEKQKIENALTCLDQNETNFFNLFYNSKSKNNMKYISIKLHMDRSHCYTVRERIVYKMMGMLYPTYDDLPLLG
ncbi:hypothetical protein [Romboutsia sp. 1001713B170131_170501_G6]|uniref:hypothetical protein n=1 Tax=Romboutsia sp. 1001713B170131_170501_G6 TaxID=2787108 RepID=UPI0018AA2251|nr:hypothetical protein [Romboutsia sp. 1001713B170131_170501_G6]